MARAYVARGEAALAGADPLRRGLSRFRRAIRTGAGDRLSRLTSRGSRTPGSRPITPPRPPALALAALGEIDPGDFGGLRFSPHPAARLLRFSHPAASIWAAHQGAGEPRPPEAWRAEDALVARPEADVLVRILPPGGYEFARALFAGATLAEAAEAAGSRRLRSRLPCRRPRRGRRDRNNPLKEKRHDREFPGRARRGRRTRSPASPAPCSGSCRFR